MNDRLKSYFSVGKADWVVRRRLVIASLLFCGFEILWASEWMRVETAQIIISQAFTMATLIISGYVIANVADDHLKRKAEAGALNPPEQNVSVTSEIAEVKPD